MRALLIIAAALVALVVGTALAMPALVDWTPYRERIASEVGAALERPVRLDGALDLALLPRPRLIATRALLPPRSTADGELRVERLSLVLDARALMAGRIAIQRIELVRPNLILPAPADVPPLRALADGLAARPVASLGAVAVDVEDGRLTLARGEIDAVSLLHGLSARLQQRDGVVRAEGDFRLGGRRTGFDLIASRGRAGHGAWRVRLYQEEAGAALVVTAEAEADGRRVTGELRLQAVRPDALAEALIPALGLADDGAAAAAMLADAKPLRAEARLAADAGRWALEDLLFESGETRGRGTLALVAPAERPRIEADLRIGRLAVAALPRLDLAALRDALAERASAEAGPLGDVELGLALAVDALAVGGVTARQAVIELEAARDRVLLRRFSAELPGAASIGAAAGLARRAGRWALEGELRGAAGSLRDLLTAAGVDLAGLPPDRLRRLELWSELTSDGERLTIDRLRLRLDGAAASGDGELTLVGEPAARLGLAVDRLDLDGYLPAVDGPLAPALAAAARMLADRLPPLDPPQLGDLSLRLDLVADRLVHGAVEARDVELSASWRGTGIELHRLAVADFAGAELSASGRIQDLGGTPTATLQVEADTTVPGPLLRRLWGTAPAGLDRFAHGWLTGFVTLGAAAGELDLGLGLGGLTATFEGGYDEAGGQGRIALRHADAGALAADLLGVAPGGGEAAPFDLSVDTELRGRTVKLEGLRLALGDALLEGRGRADLAEARPRIVLALRASDLDLDPALALLLAGADGEMRLHRPLDLAPLAALDGEATLEAHAIRAGGLVVTRPSARFALADGALALERLDGGLSGGAVTLAARVAHGSVPTVELGLDVSDARLAPGAFAIGLFRIGDGLIEGRARLASRGRTPWALLAAAEGEGRFRLRGAEIDGFAGEGWRDRLLAVTAGAGVHDRLVRAVTGGTTTVRDLVLPFTVEDGVARADALRLGTPDVVGAGSARLDLARRALRLDLALEPRGEPSLPPLHLVLAGPVTEPELYVAAPELIDLLIRRQVGLEAGR